MRPFDRYLMGVGVLAAAAAVPMVLLRDPVASLLVGDLGAAATATASTALLLLWGAGTAQLVAGCCAAASAVQGRLVAPAVAYGVGALLAVVLTAALAGPLGISSVSVGVLCGSLVTAGLLLSRASPAAGGRRWHGEGCARPVRSSRARPRPSASR